MERTAASLGPILVADGDAARRSFIRNAFGRSFELVEIEATGDIGVLEKTAPVLGVVGRLWPQFPAPIEIAGTMREACPATPVVLIGDPSSEELAIAALRVGVRDYLSAPVTGPQLIGSMSHLMPGEPGDVTEFPELVGHSIALRNVKRLIAKLAPTDCTVLITGETGTGKELVATALHRHSRRATEAFVCINCAAIPETLIESELFGFEKGSFTGAAAAQPGRLKMADRGTAFLDEIGDMSAAAQAKVLRTIESRQIHAIGARQTASADIRFMAATHQDLEVLAAEGRFRSDLFYRLNVARIHVPPLRERREDIPQLAQSFLRELSARHRTPIEGFTPAALRLLTEFEWPGNIRQLRNVLEMATLMTSSRWITEKELRALHGVFRIPSPLRFEILQSPVVPMTPLRPEPDRVLEALQATNWNKTKAAKLLRFSRLTLYRKLAKYGLSEKLTAGDADSSRKA